VDFSSFSLFSLLLLLLPLLVRLGEISTDNNVSFDTSFLLLLLLLLLLENPFKPGMYSRPCTKILTFQYRGESGVPKVATKGYDKVVGEQDDFFFRTTFGDDRLLRRVERVVDVTAGSGVDMLLLVVVASFACVCVCFGASFGAAVVSCCRSVCVYVRMYLQY
jgi:hypothetical protein